MQDVEENVTASEVPLPPSPVLSAKGSQVSDQPIQQDFSPTIEKQVSSTPVETSPPSSDHEKTRSPFRFTLKKGEAIKSLETPLDTWRFILITIALLVAGFMVSLF